MFADRFTGMMLALRRPGSPLASACLALALAASAAPAGASPSTASNAAAGAAAPGAVSAAEPLDLKFSQFFRQPIGDRGLALSDALLAADGRTVRLVGYMVSQEQARPGRFWLTPRPVRMSEHADGEADDLPPGTVTVQLDASQRDRLVAHREGLMVLTGVLRVGRFEDETGRVSWVRLELPPEALATDPGGAQTAAAAAGHMHSHPH